MSDILLFFLTGIPEMMGITALALALARVPLRWKLITCIGTALALIIYPIRLLPFTFGVHIIVGMVVLVFILLRVTYLRPSKCFVMVFISYITLASCELVIHESFLAVTNMSVDEVMSNAALWAALGMVQAVLINLIAIITSKLIKPDNEVWKI
ncbi:MAG: hypothetical protein FH758_00850 [Firmicutes bacterium]|nr:hypothetical protein [Bacillota bacterium]